MEEDGDDYIRPNADLEMKPHMRSKEQPKCMYSECLDDIGPLGPLCNFQWFLVKPSTHLFEILDLALFLVLIPLPISKKTIF